MDVETILFDLDSTLCRHCRAPDTMLAEAFDQVGVTPYCTAADLSAVASDVPTAESDVEFYAHCLDAVAEQNGATLNPEHVLAAARAYVEGIDHCNVEFVPGADGVLQDLSEYALGLVTNGGRYTQEVKLDALDIRDAFDAHVFATPEKGLKPDPYPFERALQELDAVPETTVHVGDSLHADVAGANVMGIRSVWVPHDGRGYKDGPIPDHILDSLADLPTLLG